MEKEKQTKHYNSRRKILLVGEGDFSFAARLARAFGNASNMVTTSLDSEQLLLMDHPSAAGNLSLLKDWGCTIIHRVNATTMSSNPIFANKKIHQDVVRGFLRNAYEMVTERGEAHVTYKTAHSFFRWDIEGLGREVGLELKQRAEFSIYDYLGYENKRGSGSRSNQTFPIGDCITYKFSTI